jgi:type I restriction enzyme M protein
MSKQSAKSPTTPQSLGSLLKSARDIMRKDKGLNGDLDRLPMLTWIMFLKFLDDLEIQREEEAKLSGKKFKPAIEAPYRWRDWAANQEGLTGDELLAFINQEEAILPTGKKGIGMFRYLRHLTSSNGDNRRDVIATVFRGVQNRMINGYLLRDLVNKVAGIHFTSSSELHTLGSHHLSIRAIDQRLVWLRVSLGWIPPLVFPSLSVRVVDRFSPRPLDGHSPFLQPHRFHSA